MDSSHRRGGDRSHTPLCSLGDTGRSSFSWQQGLSVARSFGYYRSWPSRRTMRCCDNIRFFAPFPPPVIMQVTSHMIECPPHLIGLLIGRGGSTIKRIKVLIACDDRLALPLPRSCAEALSSHGAGSPRFVTLVCGGAYMEGHDVNAQKFPRQPWFAERCGGTNELWRDRGTRALPELPPPVSSGWGKQCPARRPWLNSGRCLSLVVTVIGMGDGDGQT